MTLPVDFTPCGCYGFPCQNVDRCNQMLESVTTCRRDTLEFNLNLKPMDIIPALATADNWIRRDDGCDCSVCQQMRQVCYALSDLVSREELH